jgi:hypothetical protein
MSTNNNAESYKNSVPGTHADAAVIRTVSLPGSNDNSRFLPVLFLAWIVGLVVHGVILALFFFVTVNVSDAQVAMQIETISTKVDDEKAKEANLTNDDLGALDPNEFLNYNLNRQDDMAVPGPVNPTENVGMKDAAEAMRQNIPPPPGLGGSEGQGGGLKNEIAGLARPDGFAGGMSGLFSPGSFGGRSGSTREKLVREGGGNGESEAAVASGQKWIVEHQFPDGHWSLDNFNVPARCNCDKFGKSENDIAATAFGLLPLLGAGETHKNKKSLYGKNVEKGLKFLILKQQQRDGNYGGGMYAHGLATIAMCEAYAMTSDPLLKLSAQRAINFIRAAQSAGGGWRYEPRQGGDTSVVGWQVMALKSGQMAGLEVDDARNPTLSKASKFLNSVMTADGSGYGYTSVEEVSPTMTSVGLLCRLYLGTGPRNSGVVGGVNRLKQTPPGANKNIYYYYYATQVMHHVGGEAWEFWNPRMRQFLVKNQDQGTTPGKPHLKGSWTSVGDPWGATGGRFMTTSLSLLTLEVYYRHLPLYRRDFGAMTAK